MSGRLASALATHNLTLFQSFRMSDEELLALEGVGSATVQETRIIQAGNSLSASVVHRSLADLGLEEI